VLTSAQANLSTFKHGCHCKMNESVFYVPFQRIVRLNQDSNIRKDEKKEHSPFWHTLAGRESTLPSQWLEVSWPATLIITPRISWLSL